MMTLGFAFLIGLLAGLRSLTPPAATAWAAHLGWLKLPRLLSWIGTVPAVAVCTVLAFYPPIREEDPLLSAQAEQALRLGWTRLRLQLREQDDSSDSEAAGTRESTRSAR